MLLLPLLRRPRRLNGGINNINVNAIADGSLLVRLPGPTAEVVRATPGPSAGNANIFYRSNKLKFR